MTSREAFDSRITPAEWKRRLFWLAAAFVVLAVAIFFRMQEGPRAASAATPPAPAEAGNSDVELKAAPPQHDVMAIVNGQDISRKALGDACVRRYGEQVLEGMVGRRLIQHHCNNRQIKVTNDEIAAEIDATAKRFQLGREQFLELIQKERGVTPQEYARDIVWQMLALEKLAGDDVKATPEEVNAAYEREYGPMVRCRLIAVRDAKKAQTLHGQLAARPQDFARAAIENSEDVGSASVGGLIQPIRRHMGDQRIEDVAFGLQPGQVSPVIQVGEQYVILKCDEHIAARPVQRAEVEQRLVEKIKGDKLRTASHDIFAKLEASSTIVNVFNDPALSQRMPGVVATVNGEQIAMSELASECLARHGEEVLEGEISKLLLQQSLAAAQLKVTQPDLDAEILHAAELAGALDEKGDADVAKWIATVTKEQGITRQQYIDDAVWPSAALKKLTASEVKVDDEDIRKGFEANYGERVRCRAIVLGNMRRAQEVWEKARKNTSPDYFGDLAEEYSIEPTSKALRGEVPPLGKHGGQPQLEDAAFQLQQGQLSGIIQVADKFVILRCDGRTERIQVDETEVRDLLYRDIYEKKLRIAMSEKYDQLREKSRIDNYLEGTSTAPDKPATGPGAIGPVTQGTPAVREDAAVRPTSAASR